MKTALKFASLLACAFSVHAQITAVLKRFPARGPEIEIRNDSQVNLTALAVSMAPVATAAADGAPFLVYVDTAVDGDRVAMPYRLTTVMPLPPGEQYMELGYRTAGKPGSGEKISSSRPSSPPQCSPTGLRAATGPCWRD